MNIFDILKHLYTDKHCQWILDVDDSYIQPFLINRWLAMNESLYKEVRFLDKYVFTLPPKMFLSMAWSVIKKQGKTPYVKYIKKAEDEEEFDFILKKIRKHFAMADNDYEASKQRLIEGVKNDMVSWFKYYGVGKTQWKRYRLDVNLLKGEKKAEALERWF